MTVVLVVLHLNLHVPPIRPPDEVPAQLHDGHLADARSPACQDCEQGGVPQGGVPAGVAAFAGLGGRVEGRDPVDDLGGVAGLDGPRLAAEHPGERQTAGPAQEGEVLRGGDQAQEGLQVVDALGDGDGAVAAALLVGDIGIQDRWRDMGQDRGSDLAQVPRQEGGKGAIGLLADLRGRRARRLTASARGGDDVEAEAPCRLAESPLPGNPIGDGPVGQPHAQHEWDSCFDRPVHGFGPEDLRRGCHFSRASRPAGSASAILCVIRVSMRSAAFSRWRKA